MPNSIRLPVAGAPQSYWQHEGEKLHLNVEDNLDQLPTSCDVAIIGGGYSGIATAYHLLKSDPPPASVLLLEAREPCSGATGRNGGHFRPDRLSAPTRLSKDFGPAAALEVMQFEMDHLRVMKELIKEEAIDCDFRETTCLVVLTTSEQVTDAGEMFDALRRTPSFDKVSWDDVSFHTGDDVPYRTGISQAKGYFTMPTACLSPYKLLMALLKCCIENGL